jgi:hypothetical protein
VSYTDDKNFGGRVCFCQPMREFLQKEVGLYNYFESVQTIKQLSLAQHRFQAGLKTKGGPPHFGSADILIQNFFS